MTPIVVGMYIVFEVELNNRKYAKNRKDEDKMPYDMSDLYQVTRGHVVKFYASHLSYVAYAFYTGAIIFMVYYFGISSGGILFENGQTQDLFSFGIITVMTFDIQHHLQVALNMRNWSLMFTFWWLFSLG